MDTKLHELFIDQLRDAYDAEHRILEALPKKIKAAQSEELRSGLEQHLAETQEQVNRLEKVFTSLDIEAKRNTCEATKGLIKEAEELLSDFEGSSAIDAAIVCAGQKIEHYEIATYGCLCTWAKQMGHDEAFVLLHETLEEEKAADEILSRAAIGEANLVANDQ
ncbi:ferritin-like domain-containing protein [Pelagicoccus sp. SDUM812005]|uniref:YciE/YciF ferroxidase family protein n=1 Tax=Pelagicoccus sp. SDUM812005 TaxID=3041257 RepID=UPI00280EB7AC|nr:ferritin-like domain-containing protein [Pelagicoccus sp. SDUM812005]MDQ8181097.1 ferritin-like domain-containing protein [Pelagicoccus sp. SDUM812005]